MYLCRFATLCLYLSLVPMVYAKDARDAAKSTFPKISRTVNVESQKMKPHLGLMAGVADPEASFKSVWEYGIDVGFQPITPIGFAVELSGVQTDRMHGPQHQKLNRTNLLGKATYHLAGTIPVIRHSYLGLGLGPIFETNSPYDGTHLGIAPLLGFDIPLKEDATNKYVSLGVAAKYLFVSGASPDQISLNGMVKYWF